MGIFSKKHKLPDKEEIMRNGGLKGHIEVVRDHHSSRPYEVEEHNCYHCGDPMVYRGGAWFCRKKKCNRW